MNREFWFVVGSQFLYGPEVLEIVDSRAKEMAAELTKVLPYENSKVTMDIYAKAKYNKPEELSSVVNGALKKPNDRSKG